MLGHIRALIIEAKKRREESKGPIAVSGKQVAIARGAVMGVATVVRPPSKSPHR